MAESAPLTYGSASDVRLNTIGRLFSEALGSEDRECGTFVTAVEPKTFRDAGTVRFLLQEVG